MERPDQFRWNEGRRLDVSDDMEEDGCGEETEREKKEKDQRENPGGAGGDDVLPGNAEHKSGWRESGKDIDGALGSGKREEEKDKQYPEGESLEHFFVLPPMTGGDGEKKNPGKEAAEKLQKEIVEGADVTVGSGGAFEILSDQDFPEIGIGGALEVSGNEPENGNGDGERASQKELCACQSGSFGEGERRIGRRFGGRCGGGKTEKRAKRNQESDGTLCENCEPHQGECAETFGGKGCAGWSGGYGRIDSRKSAGIQEVDGKEFEPGQQAIDLAASEDLVDFPTGSEDDGGDPTGGIRSVSSSDGMNRKDGKEGAEKGGQTRSERRREDDLSQLDQPNHQRRLMGVDDAVSNRDKDLACVFHFAGNQDESRFIGFPITAECVFGAPKDEDKQESEEKAFHGNVSGGFPWTEGK